MDHSLETDVAAAASAGGFLQWRRKHAVPPGTPCYNCATPLRGPWCFACGQLGEDFHRSIWHLLAESFESFFHADGRLWRTLPRLITSPAGLTHDYLSGKRAPQLPPLRLFLVVLLLVFVAGSLAAGPMEPNLHGGPDDIAQINKMHFHVYAPWDEFLNGWVRDHLGRAVAHPERLLAAMEAWAHDFAFLALPVSALILSGIFIFRRGYYAFDHLIFSMHSLSFQGLLVVTFLMINEFTNWPAGVLLLASPVHLFAHMRGVYKTSVLGTLFRMLVLFTASSIAYAIMMVGLVIVGLAALRA